MTKYSYAPKGVCSQQITFALEDGKLHDVSFVGGCNGNLKAIGRLVEGADAAQIVEILSGNTCGPRPTSCADQLAQAVRKALDKQES